MDEVTFGRIPDDSDRATELEMASTEDAIRETRKLVKQQQVARPDGTYEIEDCEDCGNEIGIGRLRCAPANLVCVECATLREKRSKYN